MKKTEINKMINEYSDQLTIDENHKNSQLTPEQQKRVDEQNEIDSQYLNQSDIESKDVLEWKLKELGVRNIDINANRMRQNQIEYILTGEVKFKIKGN